MMDECVQDQILHLGQLGFVNSQNVPNQIDHDLTKYVHQLQYTHSPARDVFI